MNDRKYQKTSPLKYVAVILLIVFLVSSGLFALSLVEKCSDKKESAPVAGSSVVEHNGVSYTPKSHVETVLFLGLDKFEGQEGSESYNNDKQADFALLMVFDNKAKEWSAIHLSRDTMVEADLLDIKGTPYGTTIEQLALAHTHGDGGIQSFRNVRDAVERLLELVDINNCVTVTMDAVPVYNDLAGGVTLEILDDFSSVDSSLVKGETVTLKGQHALTYVRARQGVADETNDSRMKRQRQYMNALYEQTKSRAETDPEFVTNAVEALINNENIVIQHDCGGIEGLSALADKIVEYEYIDTYTLEGDLIEGENYMEFYPDEEKVKELVLKLFYDVNE